MSKGTVQEKKNPLPMIIIEFNSLNGVSSSEENLQKLQTNFGKKK